MNARDPLAGLDAGVLAGCMQAAGSAMTIADARLPGMPLVYVNPAFERLTGYPAAETLGRSCSFLQGTDRRQPELATIRRALARGEGVDVTLRNYRSDGELFWNRLVLAPVRGSDGLPVHYVGVQTDVTARVQAEHRTAGVLDRIEDAFFALDREHRFSLVNRRLEALLERRAAQLVGAGVWEAFPDGVGARLHARAMRAAREMTPSIFREYWPTGARWIEARMFPAREGVSVYLRDVTEDHLRDRRLAHLARHDALTGLPNRDAAIELLGEACSAARSGGRRVAVACVDLDRFGAINEARGHRAGDAVLKEVAARLVGSRPGGASVARMGADEFVAVLDTDDDGEALAACDGMLSSLSAPIELADGSLRIGASVGVAVHPQGGADPDALLANASAALLVARQEGAGRARLFDAALGRAQRRRQELLDALRSGEFDEAFHIVYQPKFTAAGRELCGFEALARWQSASLGAVAPQEFIPLAEECGAIVPLGRWLLDRVCAQLRAWLDLGLAARPVAVNVSVGQVANGDFLEAVEDALRRWRLPPELLQVEITESLLMQDLGSGSALAHALTGQGIEVHLDDFGTGYSSLAYLWELPVSALKLDRRFTLGLGAQPQARAIVDSVVALARALGKTVIAEGVETDEQARVLLELGCDVLQGYLLARPMAAAAAALLLPGAMPAGARHRGQT
jgi:diguanylate cyclase (GGDEF)-like protein/PAS domain S-box-containing protein